MSLLAHDHPLSPEEPSNFPRRHRGITTSAVDNLERPVTTYFDLKSQSEARAAEFAQESFVEVSSHTLTEGWTPRPTDPAPHEVPDHSSNLLWTRADPYITSAPKSPRVSPVVSITINDQGLGDVPSDSWLLTTPWHRQSDEEIEAAIMLSRNITYQHALRVLSSTVEDLGLRHAQLQSLREKDLAKEERARKRVKQMTWDMQPSEREIARRIIDAVFEDEDDTPSILQPESEHVSWNPNSFFFLFLIKKIQFPSRSRNVYQRP